MTDLIRPQADSCLYLGVATLVCYYNIPKILPFRHHDRDVPQELIEYCRGMM
jgi:hypothetical protein